MNRKLQNELNIIITDLDSEPNDGDWLDDMSDSNWEDLINRLENDYEDEEDIDIEIDNEDEDSDDLIDEIRNRPILRGATTLWSENLNPVQVSDKEREQIQITAGIRKKPKPVITEQTNPLAKVMQKRAGIKKVRNKKELPTRLIIEDLEQKKKLEENEHRFLIN